MNYSKWPKKRKTVFHIFMWVLILLLGTMFSGAQNETTENVIGFIYIVVLGLEITAIIIDVRAKKKKKELIEKSIKKNYTNQYETAPYHFENWLRIFGYKREFNLVDGLDIEVTSNKGLKINFRDNELYICINETLIGKLNDEDLIGHLNNYWEDEGYDVAPVLQEINYSSGKGKIQINFYKQIKLEDNPKVQIVETKLIKIDESQHLIESLKSGTYLKVYRDDEKSSRFYVTNPNGETLGDVKKEVAKLIDEYFDNGYVIAQLKEVIDETDHTDALVKFYFIQKGA